MLLTNILWARLQALPSRVVESDVYLREQRRNQELEARLEAQVHAAAIKRETMLAERECFEKMLEQREVFAYVYYLHVPPLPPSETKCQSSLGLSAKEKICVRG